MMAYFLQFVWYFTFQHSATKLDTLIDMYKSIQEILCIDEAS